MAHLKRLLLEYTRMIRYIIHRSWKDHNISIEGVILLSELKKKIKSPIVMILILLLIVILVFLFYRFFDWRKSKRIDIIYTANLQGAILDLPCNRPIGKVEFYTLPRVAALVEEMAENSRKDGVPALAIDGGNTLFGVDDLSLSQNGRPAIHILASAGYEAIAPGEAEFLFGLKKIEQMSEGGRRRAEGGGRKTDGGKWRVDGGERKTDG